MFMLSAASSLPNHACVCHILFSLCALFSGYGDGAGNTIEENSGVFSLIQMR